MRGCLNMPLKNRTVRTNRFGQMTRTSQRWFPLISRPQSGQQIAASTKRSDWKEQTICTVNSQSETSALSMLGLVVRNRIILFFCQMFSVSELLFIDSG